MGYKEMYQSWLDNPYFDEDTKAELKSIAGDDKEIEDRFYTELEFGTAGLRGVIGAGMNRMNIYTVRKARRDLQTTLKKSEKKHRALPLLLIQEECHRSLQTKQHFALRQMESRHMYLNP